MRAVINALKSLNPPKDTVILLKSDNSSVVAYVNKQGGTRSVSLMLETFTLFEFLQARNITLRARYLPGVRNVLADSLSRKEQILPSEWSLHPSVVREIFKIWETPMVDLFATSQNNKLPLYVSPLPDPQALAEDALAISWENMWAYAYPPTSIMTKVLEKIMSTNCHIILVAPAWPGQPWFQDLLRLSIREPLRLPEWRTLLKQTGKNVFHTNPGHLRLHAWNLQNKSYQKRILR